MSCIGPTVYPPATVSLGVSLDSEVDRLTLASVPAERFTRNVQGYFENQEKDLDALQSKLPRGRQVDDSDLAVLRQKIPQHLEKVLQCCSESLWRGRWDQSVPGTAFRPWCRESYRAAWNGTLLNARRTRRTALRTHVTDHSR